MEKDVITSPTQTEYKGIVFDSKSEAVFARTLDLAGHEWHYHPVPHCGHAWDFLVFPMCTTARRRSIGIGDGDGRKWYRSTKSHLDFRSEPMLIEYKPTMPTMTYVKNLTEMMRKNPVESIVVHGNPWCKPHPSSPHPGCCYSAFPIFSSYGKFGWGDFNPMGDIGEDLPFSQRHPIEEMLGIYEWMAQAAKEYRFDLIDSQN